MMEDETVSKPIPPQNERHVMAIANTMMSNQRTLLSCGRTALGLFGAGIGTLKFLDFPMVGVVGLSFIAASVLVLAIGIRQYFLLRMACMGVKSKDLGSLQRSID